MLGRFSITWKDQILVGGANYSESQFVYLIQILIHAGEKGVSRTALEEVLFEAREITNIRHATQSVIYNAKKKLKQAGLPDVNYIEQKNGVFYWTNKIPVVEDAVAFEELCHQADKAEVLEEKLRLYLDACYTYTGEFLASQAGVLWIAQEARRYHALFCSAAENAAGLLRITQDYTKLEALGRYAARIDPLANWEALSMEALTALGRYDEAIRLYDDTVRYYMQEEGLKPSRKMMDLLSELGEKMQHTHEVLDEIQDHLSGRAEGLSGGYVCSYPVFQGIYRMVERMIERGGQSIFLMLCTIVDGKGNAMREGAQLEELSARLGEAIQESVRHSDAITRYGKGQYLVLLINTTLENCAVVQKRINHSFIIRRQRTGVEYYVNSVLSPYH
ncbi:MAG: hypothetical protein IJ106_13300 [Parasporobacterium sp.]|nr:hypothetical protein [Parasporobacterium sp.]